MIYRVFLLMVRILLRRFSKNRIDWGKVAVLNFFNRTHAYGKGWLAVIDNKQSSSH